jgi:hypothetical protein
MLKRRVAAVEKRLAGCLRPNKSHPRIIVVYDGDPEPQALPGENLLIFRIAYARSGDDAPQPVKDGQ